MVAKKNDKEKISRKQKKTLKRATLEEQPRATVPLARMESKTKATVEKKADKAIAPRLVPRTDVCVPPAPDVVRDILALAPPWSYLFLALLLAVVAAGYCNTFQSPFLFDDIDFVVGDRLIGISDLSLSSLLNAGFGEGINKSRWVANISFALNRYFTGTAKYGFHATNLAFHLCATLMVYLLSVTTLTLPRLGFSRQQAMLIGLLAAGLWGANPVQTNAVTYIYQRMTSMAALFYMASLLCYVKARVAGKHHTLLFAAAFGLGFFALGCKEISAMLPISILAYELYFLRDSKRGVFNKKILIVSILVVVLPLIVAFVTTGGNVFAWIVKEYSRYNFTLGERLLTEPRVVIFYLSLFFLPLPSRLNLLHDFPVSHGLFDPWQTILAILAILALAVVGALAFKRHRLFSFAVFWYLANLVIESSFIALDLIFEHRLYLPTVFLCIFLAVSIFNLLRSKTLPFLVTALVCVVVLSGLTWQRNKAFASAVSFWSDVALKSPQMPNGYQGLYTALRAAGKPQEARANLLKAFEVDPTHQQTAYDLAALYRDEQRSLEALQVLNKSLGVNTALPDQALMTSFTLNNILLRGDIQLGLEKYAGAKQDYEFYLRYTADNPDALINLSIALRETGEAQRAIKILNGLPEIQKKSAIFYVNLGQAYHNAGQLDKALEVYQQGIAIDPSYSELHFNLGLAYQKKGMKEEGNNAMRKGILLRTQPRKETADPHAFLKR